MREWFEKDNMVEQIIKFQTNEKIDFRNNLDIFEPNFLKYSLPTSDTIRNKIRDGQLYSCLKPGFEDKIKSILNQP